MFQNSTMKELQLLDNGSFVGFVRRGKTYDFKKKSKRPFVRNGQRELLEIGFVDYEHLDKFIVNSMNDYYAGLNNCQTVEERDQRIKEYNDLYQLWYHINATKEQNDPNLNSYYDDILYRLYLLGYRSR